MWSLFRVWEKTFDMIFRSLIRFDSEQTKILSPPPPHPHGGTLDFRAREFFCNF